MIVRPNTLKAGLLAGIGLIALPPLATADDWDNDPWGDEEVTPLSWYGFIEGAAGYRTRSNDLIDDDMPLGEVRFQLEGQYAGDRIDGRFKLDGLADSVEDKLTGDVREARLGFSVGERTDVRLGRQVLTWGTGDLVFLNDLFPKDWVSFLIGRDDEYLKGTNDAVRVSWFGDRANIDAVWTPFFEPDNFIEGVRLSYFDPMQGELTAAPPLPLVDRPARTFDNGELATRIYGMAGSQEWAIYLYRGFFGQPTAFNPESGHLEFARLNSLGASLRGPLGTGLYNLEFSYYDSADNRDGDDPMLPNSEFRFLAGYEQEIARNLTLGTQYYVEWLQDFDELEANFQGDPATLPEEYRQLITVRLTQRLMRDNLTLGLMSFYSPDDEDWFLRPTVNYRLSDELYMTAGANLFGGEDDHTFYGQFEKDSSVFLRLKRTF
ncbi:hypothetical protein [Natronospira sp.]|uniref:hypothetical protein n=1 Tax=Natronospira sp. TaxID=2024970 RepID=UPI003873645E